MRRFAEVSATINIWLSVVSICGSAIIYRIFAPSRLGSSMPCSSSSAWPSLHWGFLDGHRLANARRPRLPTRPRSGETASPNPRLQRTRPAASAS